MLMQRDAVIKNTHQTIIILGGGMGGIVAANELRKKAPKGTRIVLIDKGQTHVYSPAFLYVMQGKRRRDDVQRPLSLLRRKGIEFINEEITNIDPEGKVVTSTSQTLHYDYLVVSVGAELAPEKISGLAESGYNLYALNGVERLRDDLQNFSGGKVAVVISSLPFKCPAAPYEAAFLLHEHFRKQGLGKLTEVHIYTPEPLPFPAAGPDMGKAVVRMLEVRKIGFSPEVKLVNVNSQNRELQFENGTAANFDLLVFVPPHQGPKVARDSGMGNNDGWIPVDKKTLKTKYDKVYAIGDVIAATVASGKPRPKAGVFTHYEAMVVAENIVREIKGLPADREYDGHASCFLEVGYGKAGFASGDFYAEPAPQVTMKSPSRRWHWGKILFEKYWLWKWF